MARYQAMARRIEPRGANEAGLKNDVRCSECGQHNGECTLIWFPRGIGKMYLCNDCDLDVMARNGFGEDGPYGEIVRVTDPRVWALPEWAQKIYWTPERSGNVPVRES